MNRLFIPRRLRLVFIWGAAFTLLLGFRYEMDYEAVWDVCRRWLTSKVIPHRWRQRLLAWILTSEPGRFADTALLALELAQCFAYALASQGIGEMKHEAFNQGAAAIPTEPGSSTSVVDQATQGT